MPFSTKPFAAFCLTLVLAAGQRALAVNDWSVPCTQGKCSWDVPADSSASGSVQIWGPVGAISDITPAAGWQITTKCNPNSSQQNIQLMCMGNNPDCNHLFQGNGPVNTIVRLPESCGPMPFARVAQHQVLQANLVTRSNSSEAPEHQLMLDTDFAAAGPSQGEVNFSVQGQNKPDDSNAVNRRNRRRSRPLARLSIGSFNKSLLAKPAPLSFTGQKNLFGDGSGSIDVDANLQASVGINAVAAGSIIPPKVTQFGITFGLDGNADAKLSVSGDLSGQISTGNITLFQTGFPGLSIPKIFEIGPEFALLGRIDANFGLKNVNAVVEVNHNLGGASFTFPPQGGSNSGGISSSSKQVSFSANPDVGATLGASVHLIPQVSLGINALDGTASASVFLDFDASVGLQGSIASAANPQPCLAGNADINVGVGAQGSFLGLFGASTGESLFEKNFPLFQQCFGGNANSTNSTTLSSSPNATSTTLQNSAANATATNSTSQTSAADAAVTDSASQSSATDATATDSASQTSAADATATDSTSRTSVAATNSASQSSVTDATATDSVSLLSRAGPPGADLRLPPIGIDVGTHPIGIIPSKPIGTDSGSQPIATDPQLIATGPQPISTDPQPIATGPQPIATDPQPIATDATATDSASLLSRAGPPEADLRLPPIGIDFGARPIGIPSHPIGTDSGSQPIATDPQPISTDPQPKTDSGSQPIGTDSPGSQPIGTDPGSQPVGTDSGSQPIGTNSGSQANAPDSRRHYDAPRAVRHSARFRRSHLALLPSAT